MFIFHSVYLKPVAEVDLHLEAHRAWLKTLYASGIAIVSGPKIPRTGGVIMLKASSLAEAEAIMQNDPYTLAGIARYECIEFEAKSYAEALKPLI